MQTITQIDRYTTKKDGSPLISVKGRPYTSVRIKTQEHGDKVISGFGNAENAAWQVGSTVDITVTPKGEYLNFDMPNREATNVPTGTVSPTGIADIKNLLTFKVIPELEQTKAAIAEVKFLVQALGDRLEKVLAGTEDEMSNFDRAIDGSSV